MSTHNFLDSVAGAAASGEYLVAELSQQNAKRATDIQAIRDDRTLSDAGKAERITAARAEVLAAAKKDVTKALEALDTFVGEAPRWTRSAIIARTPFTSGRDQQAEDLAALRWITQAKSMSPAELVEGIRDAVRDSRVAVAQALHREIAHRSRQATATDADRAAADDAGRFLDGLTLPEVERARETFRRTDIAAKRIRCLIDELGGGDVSPARKLASIRSDLL